MYRTDGKALDARSGFFENSSYTGVAFNTPGDPYVNSRLRGVDETQEFLQSGGWIAFIQKYFMAAILTPSDREQTLSIIPPKSDGGVYVMASMSKPMNDYDLKAGVEQRIFVGPKVRTDLMTRASDLELTIDMGWFWFLAQPLMMLLSMINGFVGNWGISIILLTVLLLKYSGKVLSFFELAIFATFFAGSTPMALIPRFFTGSRNIPSLLPISTTTDVFFSFKSDFNSFAISLITAFT